MLSDLAPSRVKKTPSAVRPTYVCCVPLCKVCVWTAPAWHLNHFLWCRGCCFVPSWLLASHHTHCRHSEPKCCRAAHCCWRTFSHSHVLSWCAIANHGGDQLELPLPVTASYGGACSRVDMSSSGADTACGVQQQHQCSDAAQLVSTCSATGLTSLTITGHKNHTSSRALIALCCGDNSRGARTLGTCPADWLTRGFPLTVAFL